MSATDDAASQVKQENEELKRKLEEFQIIFDSTPIMFWYKDTNNVMLKLNKAAAQLEGVPPEALEGKSSYDVYPHEQAAAFHRDDMEVINSGKPKLGIVEKHTAPATGEELWVQTGKVPYRDGQGKIVGVIAFATDITEQKRAQEALRQAHDKMEKQNQKLARVHEFFRSTLEQMIETVERGAPASEILAYLKSAHSEFERLD